MQQNNAFVIWRSISWLFKPVLKSGTAMPIDIPLSSLLFQTLFVTIVAFATLWAFHHRKKDLGIIDIYWGPGFFIISLIYIVNSSLSNPQLILALLTFLWSTRLGLYLYVRHQGAKGEDRRYARMRKNGGASFWWKSLFKICVLQAVIMWFIATPHHVALATPINSEIFNEIVFSIGMILFLFGLLYESIADYQLYRFKSDAANVGQTMQAGLWSYSRHPNYFGEIVLWWGLGLTAYAINPNLVAFFGPALVTFLLIKVSGVAMLKSHLENEKDGYSSYIENTNALLPWPKRTKTQF